MTKAGDIRSSTAMTLEAPIFGCLWSTNNMSIDPMCTLEEILRATDVIMSVQMFISLFQAKFDSYLASPDSLTMQQCSRLIGTKVRCVIYSR